ncbi:unnamed protein product [Adineta ricciae]|uniref:Transposase n=1 Tax=Adineta ricciae TaxID=249248 RepID=A0A815VYR8_ADIRI|nr:unnamed protein product [Adineta ricciae]CAF1538422.1 unnamed protein product [Adineta ricciae]
MTRSERECLAKRIVQHYVNIANRRKKIIVNHFLQEKIPRQSIYDTIKKFEEFGAVGDRSRTGRPKKLSKQELTRLKRLFDHKACISLRQVVPDFDVHIITISRNLKAMEVPTRARRLYLTLFNGNVELVMDDEKYFLLHNESISANRGLYISDSNATPPAVKFKRTQELEPKIFVWIAISQNGISMPFFKEHQQAVTQMTYLNECIKRRLMPFIEEYHHKRKVLF